MEKIIPIWGYKSDGTAKIFDLKEGENLPEGWSDRPEPWHHPNTAHLYPKPVEQAAADVAVPESEAADAPPKKRRGRPPLQREES
jgi:hypothetical protein